MTGKTAPLAFKTLGGSGPDVVLLHGFGADRLSWLATSPALLPFARVHALDLPGHGDSSTEVGDGTPADLAHLVAESLAAHGIARAHFVGHSLGGALALLLAEASPALVASLALIAPAGLGLGSDRAFIAEFTRLADADQALDLMRRLVARPQLINKMTAQRLLAHLDRDGVRPALALIGAGIVAAEASLGQVALAVAALNLPRLVIWGAADTINPADAKALAGFGAATHLVPAVGHLPHIENPRLVNDTLTAFLQPLCQV